jgi:hypothetical protein
VAQWLLQCNPRKWRIFDYLAAGNEIGSWSVGRYLDRPAAGDDFALWLTGPHGGVGAFGTVQAPAQTVDGSWDREFWADQEQLDGISWSLPIRVTDEFLRNPIPRDQIRADPRLAAMQVLRTPASTNPFPITDTEWAALRGLHSRRDVPDPPPVWDLAPGDSLLRTELHDRYGGSRQDGIAPSQVSPNILIFTDPWSGRQHGYYDEWAPDGTFHYTGRGQRGDQTFTSGNKAVRDHIQGNLALRLFEGSGGLVRYLGEFSVDPHQPYTWERAPETGGGPIRRVIRFHLLPLLQSTPLKPSVEGVPYREQDENGQITSPTPATPADPDAGGRGLRAHRRLQNQLARHVRGWGLIPWSPPTTGPDYDLAWVDALSALTIVEVKSTTRMNEIKQLRLGLGQVLDYRDICRRAHNEVKAVLYVERQPRESRWLHLCAELDVTLCWPGEETRIR